MSNYVQLAIRRLRLSFAVEQTNDLSRVRTGRGNLGLEDDLGLDFQTER